MLSYATVAEIHKGQKLVGRFFENRTVCRLLIAIPDPVWENRAYVHI